MPEQLTRIDSSGREVISYYTYDALNRVIEETTSDQSRKEAHHYPSDDTMISVEEISPNTKVHSLRAFDPSGHHVYTIQSWIVGRDTDYTYVWRYDYDMTDQLTRRIVTYTNYPLISSSIVDTNYFTWGEGNLKKMENPGNGHTIYFDYFPDTNGDFVLNNPGTFNLYRVKKELTSKNLLRSWKDNGVATIHEFNYVFDNQRRVYMASEGGYTYKFRWRCR